MLCHRIVQDTYPSVSESASVSGTVTSFSQPVRVDEPCVYRKESWDHTIPASPSVRKILTSLRTRDGAYHHPPLKGVLPCASPTPCCRQGCNHSQVKESEGHKRGLHSRTRPRRLE
jgi:hypothetical protein